MRKYYIGSMWMQKSGAVCEVVSDPINDRKTKYKVRFDSGYETEAYSSNISDGLVKDLLRPTVYSKGIVGVGKYSRKTHGKEYSLWANMIHRVNYNPYYKDVSVCKEWYCFQTFCSDIGGMVNYSLWKSGQEYQLDKDISGGRVYSKKNCKFVLSVINREQAVKSRRKSSVKMFKATKKSTGEIFVFKNQIEFIENHGVTQQNLSKCVNGLRKTVDGWSVEII